MSIPCYGVSHDRMTELITSGALVRANPNDFYIYLMWTPDPLLLKSWWRVDLEQTEHVQSVKIFNRGDCCGERSPTSPPMIV